MKFALIVTVAAACLTLAGVVGAADKNPGNLKMALVAMKCEYSNSADAAANMKNIQANITRHLYFIDKAAAEGAEFVGFPEASLNGYKYGDSMTWLKLDGPEVQALAKKAAEKGVYVSAGMAEIDAAGKKWETQFLLGPDGKLIGAYHKIWLTAERGSDKKPLIQSGTEHPVFDVKGVKFGIIICADGTDFNNLKALADKGAKIIYGAHANTTGGTIAKWYNFRARWAGPADATMEQQTTNNDGPKADAPKGGWCALLKVYGAIHNHAGLYNPEFNPPVPADKDKNIGFASGARFIGPDGKVLAEMPSSTNKADSKEFMLVYNVPIGK